MRRFVSVWLPRFAIERMARDTPGAIPHEVLCVLVTSGPQGLGITAVSPRAEREGLRPGQRLADARAALPGLVTRQAEPEHDRKALVALAHASGRYGPARNTEGEDGLWVDITGAGHLFGGEAGLGNDLVERFARAGYTALVGISDTPGAAFILARHQDRSSQVTIAPPNKTADALASRPVSGLRLTAPAVTLLERLGLRRIGQLYDIPRTALVRRFREHESGSRRRAGSQRNRAAREREDLAQAVVTRLDQALGRIPDPRAPLCEPPANIARRGYPEGLISHDGIVSAIRDLAARLCAGLASRQHGARRIELTLYRVDGTHTVLTIGTSRPSRSPTHMIRLIEEKLGDCDAGFGIDMITLAARHIERLEDEQANLTGRTQAGHAGEIARLVDRLANRLGPDRVFGLTASASHIPERAQTRITGPHVSNGLHPDACGQSLALSVPRIARPPFLLAMPEPIEVIADIPDGPPARFRWRRLSRRILRANGPERIEPEWWRRIGTGGTGGEATGINGIESAALRTRDYYEIEDDRGGRYWVYRAGLYTDDETEAGGAHPAWFLHGLFG